MASVDEYRNRIIQGNTLKILKAFPDESIDCVVTSPPYYALRAYQTEPQVWGGDPKCNHDFSIKMETGDIRYRPGKNTTVGNNKNKEIYDGNGLNEFCTKCGAWKGELGLEPAVDLYINHLCDIFDEVKRVLKNEGTCWVNLGDTYGGSGQGWGKKDRGKNTIDTRPVSIMCTDRPPTYQVMPKSLLLVPFRFGIEMCNRGWILRNVVIWHKPSAMPQSVKDRFTVDFEYLFFFAKNKKYYFEQQFEPANYDGRKDTMMKGSRKYKNSITLNNKPHTMALRGHERWREINGEKVRNKRTVWTIPPKPFKGAHYAIFPEKLIEIPIRAGCPEMVCKKCRQPREAIFEKEISFHSGSGSSGRTPKGKWAGGEQEVSGDYDIRMGPKVEIKKKGYTDCGCNAGWEPGIVLDPFMGSGTTALVAKKLNRDFIGIELNPEYIEIAERRLKEEIPLFL